MMDPEVPRPDETALVAYRDLAFNLMQWAPTAHQLVVERIDALTEASDRGDGPTETAREFAARVHAHGQEPYPPGVAIYDDLNSNYGYEHVAVGHGEDGPDITFTGWWHDWSDDGETFERCLASIDVPGWLITDPDGVERYKQQTAEMVEKVRAEEAAERAKLDVILDQVIAEMEAERGATGDDGAPA